MIPYGRQSISEEDIQAVVDVLKSDFLTQGSTVPAFEQSVCDYTGAKYGVAVNSGTSALHVACLALGLKKGDWLWTSPITFVASANCGVYCEANIDFVDIDPQSWNISVDKLTKKLEQAKRENRLPKVLVAVHLCGLPCDMKEIHQLSQKYHFHIIEDACHAIGGKYLDESIGNCHYSDITVFSFHAVKAITTGEGGMAVTNNRTYADAMALQRNHGITREEAWMTHESDGPWYYQQVEIGFNYRMTDIHAALGQSQLKRLDQFIERKHEIAKHYNEQLNDLPISIQYHAPDKYSGMHLYVIRLQNKKLKKSHKQIFEDLRNSGIGVNVHYIPVHTQPFYQNMGFKKGDFPEAEAYYGEVLSLPMFPELKNEEINTVINAVRKCIQ